MSFIINTKYRSRETELMDDFSMDGELLHKTLDQIAKINRWLGGNRITLNGLEKVLRNYPKDKPLTIIDIGCGNGDMLRVVSGFLKRKGFVFNLIGVDANENTISYAKELSKDYPEIQYLQQDIFSKEFKNLNYDLVLATLFLHHFNEDDLIALLSEQLQKAKLGIIVNDLHRHALAYYLFKGLCLFISNPMVKQDGLISILSGFKKEDLKRISKKLNIKINITWRWAFRFQWIIQQ